MAKTITKTIVVKEKNNGEIISREEYTEETTTAKKIVKGVVITAGALFLLGLLSGADK